MLWSGRSKIDKDDGENQGGLHCAWQDAKLMSRTNGRSTFIPELRGARD